MTNIPEHIQKQYAEAEIVPLGSKEYWELRARTCEKAYDPTYTEYERNVCYNINRILQRREP